MGEGAQMREKRNTNAAVSSGERVVFMRGSVVKFNKEKSQANLLKL